jgi:WD40 repeat protein
VQIREVATGTLLRKFPVAAGALGDVAWHPDGPLLAVVNDFHIHLWNLQTGQQHAVVRGHQAVPQGLHFSPGGELLCSWSWDATVRLWNPWSGQEVCRLVGTHSQLSQDGRHLACRRGKQLYLWEVVGGQEYRILPGWEENGHSQLVQSRHAKTSPDGQWLAVAETQGVRLFDLAHGKQAALLSLGEHGKRGLSSFRP